MRARITLTGVLVLVLGLVVAGAAYAYTNVAGEWVGGILSVLGLVTGIAGATMKRPVPQ